METRAHPPGLQDILEFPVDEALYGEGELAGSLWVPQYLTDRLRSRPSTTPRH